MPNKAERIILDTNLWISFLITKDYTKLDKTLLHKKAILIFSEELLAEFIIVCKRPKLKKYFTDKDVLTLLEAIQEHAEMIDVKTSIKKCRDEKDNFLLALAIDGKADYLLTGDKDLLDLRKIQKTRIITISEFLLKNKSNW